MRTRFFRWLGVFVTTHPWKIIIAAVVITTASVSFTAARLRLDADQDNLISEKLAYHKRYKDFIREFGDQEYLYLVAETQGNLAEAKSFIRSASEKISALSDVRQVTYKIDNPALEKSFLLLLGQDELSSLAEMTSGAFSIQKISSLANIEDLFDFISLQAAKPVSPKEEAKLTLGFKFLDGIVEGLDNAVVSDAPYSSRLEELFFGGGYFDPEGYIVTKNKKFVICFIMPAKDYTTLSVIREPLKKIRGAIDEAKKEFPHVKTGLTGRPVLAADEMETSNRDMNTATILAVAAIAVIFVLMFRSTTRPLLAVASLLMGISWTYGLVTLAVGTLNLLSIVFAIILVGSSIEYGIHVVARYQEELAHHRHIDEAIKRALLAVGKADLTSAATTAAAFATLIFTNFKALQELGAITSAGIVFCLASMLVVLPAMLVVRDHKRYGTKAIPHGEISKKARQVHFIPKLYRHPVLIFTTAVAATIFLLPFAKKISFDFNLLNLQAAGLESVKYERKMMSESGESSWFANTLAKTPQESALLAERMRKLPSVGKVEDITAFVPLDQKARMFLVRKMSPYFEKISPHPPLQMGARGNLLVKKIGQFSDSLGKLEDKAFSAGRIDAVEELEGFRDRLGLLIRHINETEGAQKRIREFESALFSDLHEKLALLASGMNPSPIGIDDLPSAIKERFISPNGQYAVYITPKEDIWDSKNLERFVKEIRTVDKNALGTPIEVFESARMMVRAFIISGILAFIVIALIAYADFKSVRAALLVCLPLLLGGMWLASLMGLFGIPFNLANFFAVPIIIGIGVDSGVHILHRIGQEKELASLGRATGTSVLLTAITNIVSFGMMMMASHHGIASLGEIMAIGTACTAIAALVVMPKIAWHVLGHHGR